MKRLPAFVVVAGWALFNGLLLAVLGIYGEQDLVFWLWGGVVVLLGMTALLVLVSSRSEPEQHVRHRLPRGGAAAVPPAAVGIALGVLGVLAYGLWLLVLAIPPLVVAVVLLARGASTPGEG
ncbi:hypothetical protein [Streptomyces bluensis]|uniref:Integral membrane protein n=1 Tax=Streptomyces bluensis TaxID=33897 RepID=A0ABW6UBQ3_9ACTN